MSETLSRCQNCGVEFQMPKDEVVSSKILCPPCAAERRAKLRAAKAAGAAEGGDGARAAAPAAARATATTEAARPSRKKEYHAHHAEMQAAREAANKKMMKVAWMVVGGLVLFTGIVLLFVKNKQDSRQESIDTYERSLDDFRAWILKVDLKDEEALKAAKLRVDKERKLWKGTRIEGDVSNQVSKINVALSTIIKTRTLRESLDSIDAKLATNPDLAGFAGLFTLSRDADIQMQATDAGGEWKTRYDSTRQRVAERYIESLRGACRSAATATSGDALAPFGTLEDILRTVVIEARGANDVDTQKKYEPVLMQTYNDINNIGLKLFDDAYQNKIAWTDLLNDPAAWTAVTSGSFKYKFGPLTMSNVAGDGAASGGISYFPTGDNWRDYVLDIEFKLDSGVMVVYTRVGEKMDTKDVPGFSVGSGTGGKQVNVAVEYGKSNTMVVTTIGNQITVKLNDTTAYTDDIKLAKSRKGEPGIVVQGGPSLATELTITRLRARLLR